jgi:hypothetical protein
MVMIQDYSHCTPHSIVWMRTYARAGLLWEMCWSSFWEICMPWQCRAMQGQKGAGLECNILLIAIILQYFAIIAILLQLLQYYCKVLAITAILLQYYCKIIAITPISL